MIEVQGDLWVYPAQVRCVTTNLIVGANGRAVMGGGCAREARDKFPDIDFRLGDLIKEHPEGSVALIYSDPLVLAFPTKNHWKDPSSLELITQSAHQLQIWMDSCDLEDYEGCVLLPRPGCGLGGLDWEEEVRPAIENVLDDRVAVISPLLTLEKVIRG